MTMRRRLPPLRPDLSHEVSLRLLGCALVAGIDEAGRGAWAGPVVAAAVILPDTPNVLAALAGVDDSKKLSARQREMCRPVIERTAVAWAVGAATNEEIDALGIIAATRLAMCRAIHGLSARPDALVIDALSLPDIDIRQDVFNHADGLCLSVAAASILAKTERDARMRELDKLWPGYGFALHKGYGTPAHQRALAQLGAAPAHRMSFAPIRARITG
jgi:ribonuclease HII